MKHPHLGVLLLLNVYLINAGNNTKVLKLVQVLFRHGDRTPTETYPNDPYQHWPEGWGTLTKLGKQQMYQLGQLLRKTYKDFLSEDYFSETVYVRSTEADRCIMSAQTLLAGLYPPTKDQTWNSNLLWQPIPVRYIPRNEDNVIAMKKNCSLYDTALKHAYETPRIKKIDEENKDLYEYLSASTGNKMNNIHAVELLYNTLEIEILNNLTLPEWTNNVSLDKLREIAKTNFAIFSDTTLMKRLTGGAFLNEALSFMYKKINSTSKLDLVLYSGHDITIVTITRTLGFEQLLKPKYGAFIVFELYKNEDEDFEIEVLYGDSFETPPQKFEMEFCPTPCTLKNFVDRYKHVLPKDWEAECLNPY
ncbi:hypothetical protein RN001_016297 [Aquatica leii]|uniref:Lysosomal acid phosphatase n=1 Tax=Aquatica leii TaxID=1421715 RepID=A0AAN7SKD5_9COLE|nr:hypothetical protein RN001_016297 [Aquatica leii]